MPIREDRASSPSSDSRSTRLFWPAQVVRAGLDCSCAGPPRLFEPGRRTRRRGAAVPAPARPAPARRRRRAGDPLDRSAHGRRVRAAGRHLRPDGRLARADRRSGPTRAAEGVGTPGRRDPRPRLRARRDRAPDGERTLAARARGRRLALDAPARHRAIPRCLDRAVPAGPRRTVAGAPRSVHGRDHPAPAGPSVASVSHRRSAVRGTSRPASGFGPRRDRAGTGHVRARRRRGAVGRVRQ